jgi:hypothetical protein
MYMIDWNEVDWNEVDKEKAEFIYNEALDAQREVVSELNAMNSKAFQLFTLVTPVLVAVLTGLLAWWHSAALPVRAAGVVFSSAMFVSAFCFAVAVWPRRVTWAASSPAPYFRTDYYRRDLLKIIHGNIEGAQRDIEVKRKALAVRGYWVRRGIIALIGSFIPAVAAFVFTVL